ncbi:unnamed protein product, partial [Polarella glacialis]
MEQSCGVVTEPHDAVEELSRWCEADGVELEEHCTSFGATGNLGLVGGALGWEYSLTVPGVGVAVGVGPSPAEAKAAAAKDLVQHLPVSFEALQGPKKRKRDVPAATAACGTESKQGVSSGIPSDAPVVRRRLTPLTRMLRNATEDVAEEEEAQVRDGLRQETARSAAEAERQATLDFLEAARAASAEQQAELARYRRERALNASGMLVAKDAAPGPQTGPRLRRLPPHLAVRASSLGVPELAEPTPTESQGFLLHGYSSEDSVESEQ